MRHSMFSAGHPNSCIAVCEALQAGGHEVILLKKDDEKVWWDDVLSIKDDYSIFSIDSVEDLDLIIEIAYHLTPVQRAKISKKTVWYCRKPASFTDIEATVFACRTEGRNLEGVSEIWVSDIFNNSDDIEYLKVLYPGLNVMTVPWLWSPTIVEAHRKERQSPVWAQLVEHTPEGIEWTLHISETNASNTSSCTLPLLMLKGSGISSVFVHNMELLSQSKFFKDNVLVNCPASSVQLVGRQRIIDWSHDYKSIVLSHLRFIPLKQANLEAAWVGLPIVHNSEILKDFGMGLEQLYYSSNNIEEGSSLLKTATQSKIPYMYDIDSLTELRKRILYRFSPEARTKEWQEMLVKKVVEIDTRKTYKILFTDMWSDFNAEHNMFTLAIQDYLKDYKVVGVSSILDSDKPDIHIFGPFGTDWLSIESSVRKIYFTGENTGPIEHPLVKLNIGFKNIVNPSYMRMPLWMFEIDWFGADLARIQNPLPIPVSTCTSVDIQRKRTKFCAFIVSNPKNIVRNEAFHTLNKYKPIDSAGRLFNTTGDTIFAGLGGGGGEIKKHEFLKDYKFCLCYENESSDGYVTEKLLHAKAAGCIPIYWGAPDVVKDFDPRGFINLTDCPELLVEKVKEIDEDDSKWLKMVQVPALRQEKAEGVKELFNIMAERIVGNAGMLLITAATYNFWPSLQRWIQNVENYAKSIHGLRAIVYIGSDVPENAISLIKKDFLTIIRFPTSCPDKFPDFWNPQHFAWKLWILKHVSEDPLLKGSTVFYMDCASVIIRWPTEWIKQLDKISFLDDSSQKNEQWCHSEFCKALDVTEEEKASNQIAACLILFVAGDATVKSFFNECYNVGCCRNIIVGPKWEGIKDGKPFGHRHDQSILSILAQRNGIHRYPLDKIYNHTSARSTYYGGQYIYVHRGNYISHVPYIEGIDDVYVINLDRRQDRMTSFKDHHPYFKGKARRHKAIDGISLTLTPNLVNLFKPNDFFWKKAVMGCALSHLKIWTMLYNDSPDIQSYLIMEDDGRLKPEWSEAWSKVYSKIPDDWECVYLGGVLPPNKEGFKMVVEDTGIEGLGRIAPNTFFGQSVPSRQFHFCAYAYVLSRAGVNKIIQSISNHKGIWTSADHVLFNSLDKEHVYVLNPLVARASQEDDPVYINSDFNDFSRIDKFDSDLWNNDERFSPDIKTPENSQLDIMKTVDEVYMQVPVVKKNRYVSLDICQITNNSIYEYEWLKELLGPFDIEIVSKDTDLSRYDNLVVLVIRSKWSKQIEWIDSICQSGKKFKILHFSDEFVQDPVSFYDKPEVIGVLRFYKRTDILNKKVLTIPLGYHWKNTLAIIPLHKRSYIWSFHGTNWKGRSEDLSPLSKITPSNVNFYSDWKHSSQLNEEAFINLLLNTIFVPCPRGNNIETFRFYEALECGCIPVFIELPTSLLDSGIPFLKATSWNEVVDIIRHLNNNPDQLLQYYTILMDAWAMYKISLKQNVSEWQSLV